MEETLRFCGNVGGNEQTKRIAMEKQAWRLACTLQNRALSDPVIIASAPNRLTARLTAPQPKLACPAAALTPRCYVCRHLSLLLAVMSFSGWLGCATPSQLHSAGASPQKTLAAVQTALRDGDAASLFALLSAPIQAQFAESLHGEATRGYWQSAGIDPDQLAQATLAEAFAIVFAKEYSQKRGYYMELSECQVKRVEQKGPDRALLRCVHPQSQKVRLIEFLKEGESWRLNDLQ